MFFEDEKLLSCIYDFPHRARDGLQANHAFFSDLLQGSMEGHDLKVILH